MKAIFLAPNNCWAILFGDSLIDIDGQRLFPTKRDLIDALKSKGLKMQGRTIVSA